MRYDSYYELYHHGILGQKWGRRRYQNKDGSLTEEGKRRYGTPEKYERARKQRRKVATSAVLYGVGTAAAAALVGAAVYKISEVSINAIDKMDRHKFEMDLFFKQNNVYMYTNSKGKNLYNPKYTRNPKFTSMKNAIFGF